MNSDFQVALGHHLRKLRLERVITQIELASKAGITNKYLSHLERGKVNPSINILVCVAENGLQIPLSTLLSFHESKHEDELQDVIRLMNKASPEHKRIAVRSVRAILEDPADDSKVRITNTGPQTDDTIVPSHVQASVPPESGTRNSLDKPPLLNGKARPSQRKTGLILG